MEFIKSVKKFNEIAGTEAVFDERKSALYVGLVLEEVSEMLESFGSTIMNFKADMVSEMADDFKGGKYDHMMEDVDKVEFLDAAVDIMVVAAGAGIAIGADVEGAADEVCESNLSKYVTKDGNLEVIKDENGKIKKGSLYFKPSLEKFIK